LRRGGEEERKNLSEIPSFPKLVIMLDCFPEGLEVTLPNVRRYSV